MERQSTILILTAGYGEGHNQATNALRQSFVRLGCAVRVVDLFREAHPGLNAITRYLYLRSAPLSAYGFDFYGWSYYSTQHMNERGALAKWLNLLGMKKCQAIMNVEKPAAVVCTFPFGGISDWLKRSGIPVPVFTVMTDFSLHNRWLLAKPDRYYVATSDLRQAMMRHGIEDEAIAVTGIPVRQAFQERGERTEERAEAAGRTILVMAGAHGTLADLGEMADRLLHIRDARLEIVCGNNKALRRELERRFEREPRIATFGFVDSIHERMSRAACMVTKAGGITLSEAVQIRVPLLIFRPQPGQELENARYFAAKGAALVSRDVAELAEQAARLLDNPEQSRRMRKRYDELAADYASDTIAADIVHTIGLRAAVLAETGG